MQEGVNKPNRAEVFRARLTSTIILWTLVTGVFVSQNAWAFFGLVSFLTLAGAWEFRSLFSKFPGDGCRTVGLLVGLIVALSTGAFLVMGSQGHDNYFSELAGLVTVTVFCFFVRFKHGIEGRQSVDAVGDGLLAFVYVPILFGCFVYRLIFLPEGGGEGEVPGAWLLLFMIAAAKFTDMGAYITGSLIGKNKMAQQLSPVKTCVGFFGALGFAQLEAWGVWGFSGDILSWIPPLHVGVLALLIGLVAVAGDLAESILKRSLKAKDSGSLMPGIGGVLDLIDSLCFAAPVTYFYLLRTDLIS